MRPFPCIAAALALVAVVAPAGAVKRRAFVTSSVGQGNLAAWSEAGGVGALAAGDNVCRARAAAASLPNSQTYRAWLSTAATDAYCHVRGQTGKKSAGCAGTAQPAGPWYRYNGITPWSGDLDALVEESEIYRAILSDEFGDPIRGTRRIWTGTSASGEQISGRNCTSWVVSAEEVTGYVGVADRTTDSWTANFYWPCNDFYHLLCLEPGASEAPDHPSWSPAALAFATSEWGDGDLAAWPSSGGADGLPGGDEICRSLAESARLPEPDSFVAWLSDDVTDARNRLTLTTTDYRRVDGVLVASSRADLVDGDILNSIHVDETGRYLSDHVSVWTGTTETGVATALRCEDWSSDASADEGGYGGASFAYSEAWTSFSDTACSQPMRLYCFSNVETLVWDGFDLTGSTNRWSDAVP